MDIIISKSRAEVYLSISIIRIDKNSSLYLLYSTSSFAGTILIWGYCLHKQSSKRQLIWKGKKFFQSSRCVLLAEYIWDLEAKQKSSHEEKTTNYAVDDLRYAMRSARSRGFFRPGKTILVPGMYCKKRNQSAIINHQSTILRNLLLLSNELKKTNNKY